jgi:hypothetical protein
MSDDFRFPRPEPVIGTPHTDTDHFPGPQSYDDTCAIRCEEYIIRQYTGTSVPEKVYVEEARSHGWYVDGHGTAPEDVGKLLQLHDIPVSTYAHGNLFNLTSELAQGHKVIIGVDSDELHETNPVLSEIRHSHGLAGPDHTVVVSGIDTSDADHVQVIVSDPGTGEAAARYPLEQFVSAWRDSEFFMVATHEPPPAHLHLPEMRHFDYDAGHLDHIGNLSFDEFQEIYDDHGEDGSPHDDELLLHKIETEDPWHETTAGGGEHDHCIHDGHGELIHPSDFHDNSDASAGSHESDFSHYEHPGADNHDASDAVDHDSGFDHDFTGMDGDDG